MAELRNICPRVCVRCGETAAVQLVDRFGDAFASYCSALPGRCGDVAFNEFSNMVAMHGTEARAVQGWQVHELARRDAIMRGRRASLPINPSVGTEQAARGVTEQ